MIIIISSYDMIAKSAKEEKRNLSIIRYHIEIGEGKRKYSGRKVCGGYACEQWSFVELYM